MHAALACIDGVLFAASGWWSPLKPHEVSTLQAPRARALRRIAGEPFAPGSMSDSEILKSLRVLPISKVLQGHRLRYFARLVAHGPGVLQALLQTPTAAEWRHAIVQDLQEMKSALWRRLDELPWPATSMGPWIDVARSHPREWKALVKTFLQKWHSQDSDVARGAPPPEDADHTVRAFDCPTCSQTFPSNAALAMHRARVHAHRCWTRGYIQGHVCPCCGADFATRYRARRHLRNSTRCQASVASGLVEPLSEQLRAAADSGEASDVRRLKDEGLPKDFVVTPMRRPA